MGLQRKTKMVYTHIPHSISRYWDVNKVEKILKGVNSTSVKYKKVSGIKIGIDIILTVRKTTGDLFLLDEVGFMYHLEIQPLTIPH